MFNQIKVRVFVVFSALIFFGAFLFRPVFADESTGFVEQIRVGKNNRGIRAVIDLSRKCVYQVRAVKDSSKVYVDIFEVQLGANYRPPKMPGNVIEKKGNKIIQKKGGDNFLSGVRVKEVNFRQVRIEFPLEYGIPLNNVKSFALENPDRIVLDLYKECKKEKKFYITKNILWKQSEKAVGGRFTLINELYVNFLSPQVSLRVEEAKKFGKARMTVDEIVKSSGAIAGVNGGYFSNSGSHLGLLVIDGSLVASSVKRRPPRTVFAIDGKKRVYMNRYVDDKGKIKTPKGGEVKGVKFAVGAGPRLISRHKINVTEKEEALGKGGNDITRCTGRTALGITSRGKLALFTVSGFRSNRFHGMLLPEIAGFMKSQGVAEGMNLDGGGSTAMSIMGNNVSKPPMDGKYQRPVTNAVLIFDKSPIISPYKMKITPDRLALPADGVTENVVRVLVTDRRNRPVPDNTAVSFSSGYGMIESSNYATKKGWVALKVKSLRLPGNYSIKVNCGPLTEFLTVKFEAGPPAQVMVLARKISSSAAADIASSSADNDDEDDNNANGDDEDKNGKGKNSSPSPTPSSLVSPSSSPGAVSSPSPAVSGGDLYIIKVLVRDANLNPLKGKVVNFSLVEGDGEIVSRAGFTRPDGVADMVFLLRGREAKIMVSSPDLPGKVLKLNKNN